MTSFRRLGHICLLVLVCAITRCEAKKILLVSPSVGSHLLLMTSLVEPLTAKGHEVHMILDKRARIAPSLVNSGAKVIYYDTGVEPMFQTEEYQRCLMSLETGELSGMQKYDAFQKMMNFMSNYCHRILNNEALIRILQEKKYDMAVTNSLLRCLLVLPYRLGIPFVSLTSMLHPDVIAPALQAPFLVKGPIDELFFKRGRSVLNTFEKTIKVILNKIFSHFGDRGFDIYTKDGLSLADIQGKSELWLLDNSILLDNMFPVSPNVIRVGGLNIREPKLITDSALKKFVDSAHDGFVLVSFGSFAKYIPDKVMTTLLDTFSAINFKIVWKWDKKSLKGLALPAHIMVMDWLPQNDLLGHKRIKLFVTHCGNNGQHEALNNGVPMVGIPLFGDQVWNAVRIADRGFGDFIRIKELTQNRLTRMINEVIQNKSYSESIKLASRIFRGQPMTPRETAAFWVDHVLKHGSDHLRSAATDLPWYQVLMIDVLVVALLVGAVIFGVALFVCCCCYRLCRRRFQQQKVKTS